MEPNIDMSSVRPVRKITLGEVHLARDLIKNLAPRNPSILFNEQNPLQKIVLKCENLSPIGSFKLKGVANTIAQTAEDNLQGGVWTASAGNMGRGVSWFAHQKQIPCTIIVPDHAPLAKIQPMEDLGATILKVPADKWFEIMLTCTYPGMTGLFLHPFNQPTMIAGNGVIGLEILEDLQNIEAIFVPYGGGGLITGIGSVVKKLNPEIKVIAAEVETSAALTAAKNVDSPVIIDYTASFVDGMGAPYVFPEMWHNVCQLVDDTIVLTLDEIRAAIKNLVEQNHLVAEGAGAAPLAAAIKYRELKYLQKPDDKKLVAVISGGNIDSSILASIISGN